MSLSLHHLDNITRRYMVDEIEYDDAAETFYLSSSLSERGRNEYGVLLLLAARRHDAVWLAQCLSANNRMATTRQHTPSTKAPSAISPTNEATRLAEEQFHRFYLRGICRRALAAGIQAVEMVCVQVRSVSSAAVQAKIATFVDAQALLVDLRVHHDPAPVLGLPPGVNARLSVKLPEVTRPT